ncbi:MAG: CPBP family intramembrane glutamate endopeptidase, partial [Janthinobacterium sp.]
MALPPVRISMFDRAALPRVAPFLAYLSFIFIADMLARAGFAAQDLRWLYAVKIGVVLGMLLYWRRSFTELAWTRLGARATAVAIAAGFVVFLLWIHLNAGWMVIGSADGFDPRNDGQIE